LIPEPFIGDPETAKVVLLNLNPGFDATVEGNHSRSEIKDAIFRNLRRERREYPFYAFDPAFKGTGVANYWCEYTHNLQSATGLDDRAFAQRLLAIEWFPYPSTSGSLPRRVLCGSQEYSFQLAKEMMAKQGVQFIGMRSKNHWALADSEFSRIPFLKNPQRPWITRGNMDSKVFDRIVTSLQMT
jgi:hypothetical protein